MAADPRARVPGGAGRGPEGHQLPPGPPPLPPRCQHARRHAVQHEVCQGPLSVRYKGKLMLKGLCHVSSVISEA